MRTFPMYLLIIVFVFSSINALSQIRSNFSNTNGLSSQKKLSLIRENYIESKLKLSENEKAKFILLYRKYNDEINAVRKQKRQNLLNNNSKDQIQKDLQYSQRLLDIKKQYTDEFLKFLTADKVNKIFISEREFINEAINQLSESNNAG